MHRERCDFFVLVARLIFFIEAKPVSFLSLPSVITIIIIIYACFALSGKVSSNRSIAFAVSLSLCSIVTAVFDGIFRGVGLIPVSPN